MEEKFNLYFGDLMGLPSNENHIHFEWVDSSLKKGMKVLFSCSKMGKAMSCHYANVGASFQQVNRAINEFVQHIFSEWADCEMIIAKVLNDKVANRIEKLGFIHVDNIKNVKIFCKMRGE